MAHDADGQRTARHGGITGAIGPEALDELSGLKTRFPRYWMQPVRGYVAVPRGTNLIVAATTEELAAKLQHCSATPADSRQQVVPHGGR